MASLKGNTYADAIADAYVGTLSFDVRSLDPTWPDSANRDVDPAHVDKLMSSFEAGIDRVGDGRRLKVTLALDEWEFLVGHVVGMLNDQEISSEIQLPTDATGVKNLVSHPFSGNKDQLLVLPFHLPVSPILEAGQHRTAALKRFVTKHTPENKPENDAEFQWAADVYVRDHLTREALFALRANREDICKADSHGDLLARIYTILDNKSIPERNNLLRASQTKIWLMQAFGVGDDQFVGRLLQVVRMQRPIQKALKNYCQTRYGAVYFRLTWGSNVVLSGLDFIWEQVINKFVTTSNELFGNHLSKVLANDFSTLMPFLPVTDIQALDLLFFPTDTDTSNGVLVKDLAIPPYVTDKSVPTMQPFSHSSKKFTTRRPGFLTALNDDVYCGIYSRLIDKPQTCLASWKEFSQLETNVSSTVSSIVRHVVVWVSPAWEFPKRADSSRKSFEWDTEVTAVVLESSKLVEGGKRGFDPQANRRQVARDLIQAIWDEVCHDQIWKEKSVTAEAKQRPETVIGEKAKGSTVEMYLSRFHFSHWAKILSLVRGVAGPALAGNMEGYNNKDLEMSMNSSSSFGQIATNAIYKQSQEVLTSSFLNNKRARVFFNEYFTTAALTACYVCLKGELLRTLKSGYQHGSGRISNEEEWLEVLDRAKHYAALLDKDGHPVNLDDRNEEEENGPPEPGLLTMRPQEATRIQNQEGTGGKKEKRKNGGEKTSETRTSKRFKKTK